MFSVHSLLIGATLSAFFLAGHATAASRSAVTDETAEHAASAPLMSAEALEKLYGGRTWKWKAGGAYLSKENTPGWFIPSDWKQFSATSRENRKWTFAEGSWYTTKSGKLCFNAIWTSKNGRDRDLTCFVHRAKNGVIYQKRSIGGKWYVFRHHPRHKNDEVMKLLKGDYVSKDLLLMKRDRK
jgi:hypothetical protein